MPGKDKVAVAISRLKLPGGQRGETEACCRFSADKIVIYRQTVPENLFCLSGHEAANPNWEIDCGQSNH